MLKPDIVWLNEERTYAVVVQRGTFFSTVAFTRGGHDYEILVENDEFDDYQGDNDDED